MLKEYMSDSFTNYNYVGNTKVSVSIKQEMSLKKTNGVGLKKEKNE